MKYKTLTTSFISLLMLNIGLTPVFANPVIEEKTAENHAIQANSEQNSIILISATPDTPGAVQIVSLEDYIALKGEASLEDKQVLEVYPESSSPSVANKDLTKDNNKSALPQEADYFVVLPEGQELSATEMEKIEGEGIWIPMAIGATKSLVATTIACHRLPGARCGWQQYVGAAGSGALWGVALPIAKAHLAGQVAGQVYNAHRATWWMR
jgi:hypothetical protein